MENLNHVTVYFQFQLVRPDIKINLWLKQSPVTLKNWIEIRVPAELLKIRLIFRTVRICEGKHGKDLNNYFPFYRWNMSHVNSFISNNLLSEYPKQTSRKSLVIGRKLSCCIRTVRNSSQKIWPCKKCIETVCSCFFQWQKLLESCD